MKWIIFATAASAGDVKAVSAFLKNQRAEHDLYRVAVQNDFSANNSMELKNLCKLLRNVTHCILLYAPEMDSFSPLLYAAGFFEGAGIPVFITGFGAAAKAPHYLKHATCFESAEKMYAELTEKFCDFRKEEEKKAALKKLFSAGIPFTPDAFSFHIAKGNIAECELFVTGGMDVNSRDSAGTPMICIAARSEKKDMIAWLVEKGADIDATSADRGYTAVMDAVWRSNVEITELLLKLGAGLQVISRDGQSILVLAVGNGNARICELLVKYGANPHIKDKMGMSASEYAQLFKKDHITSLFEAGQT